MASINGIEIRQHKEFRDHDGAPVNQGIVYYKGKKLGFWTQDSWGGPDNYSFDERILDGEVERFKNSGLAGSDYIEYVDADSLLDCIVSVKFVEKFFKKVIKKGCTAVIASYDGPETDAYATSGSRDGILNSENYKKYAKSHRNVYAYFAPEDFEMVV